MTGDHASDLHPAAGPDGGTAPGRTVRGGLRRHRTVRGTRVLASIPMLVRLYRRFGSWIAPALGLLVFSAMFSLSAFVIGPVISGTGGDVPPGPVPTPGHTSEHTGGH